jgi:hypothetical protein
MADRPMKPNVMICAPAAERQASMWGEGRKAESDVRTAQMITHPERQTRSLCGKTGRAQSPRGAAASIFDAAVAVLDDGRKTPNLAIIRRCSV